MNLAEIEQLKSNINTGLKMAQELWNFLSILENASESERNILSLTITSLRKRMQIINDSVPEILGQVSVVEKLPAIGPVEKNTYEIKIQPILLDEKGNKIFVKSKDKEIFLRELNISNELIRKIKRRRKIKKEDLLEMKKTSHYASLSNKFFLRLSERFIARGYFKTLSLDLRRSNSNILTATYLSTTLFSTFVSFIFAIMVLFTLTFFDLSFAFPIFAARDAGYILRFIKLSWLLIAIPSFVWMMFILYPGAEKRSIAKKIEQELPFVVIHMSSISGSGIEPGQIFRIIAMGKDYKYSGKEFTKIVNQINVYGYDLTNALRNVAQNTPSTKLSELLNGISITINSGGDIGLFFEKRADSLLLEYRLEREKFTKTTETFMDIYISIVIAAPMILLMLLIMVGVSGIQTGFNVTQLTLAIIGVIAIINVLFLTFLHFKQPTY